MGSQGHSQKNLSGGYTHYDSNGRKIGESRPNMAGGFTDYDKYGHKIGSSNPNMAGGFSHYDARGHKTGQSNPNMAGGYNHYDSHGRKTGSSNPNWTGGYNNYSGQSGDGCYIATCVYGSYDCSEVWTLRRFRDRFLAATLVGRLFIKVYYSVSPKLVKVFGNTRWFKTIWKRALDKMVESLHNKGYEDTPYQDPKY